MKTLIWVSVFAFLACSAVGIASYYEQKKTGNLSQLYLEQDDDPLQHLILVDKQLETDDFSRGPLPMFRGGPVEESSNEGEQDITPQKIEAIKKDNNKSRAIKKMKTRNDEIQTAESETVDANKMPLDTIETVSNLQELTSASNDEDTTLTKTVTYRSFSRAPLPKEKSKRKFWSANKTKE